MLVEEECYVVYIKLIHCQTFHWFIHWNGNPRLKVKGARCQHSLFLQRLCTGQTLCMLIVYLEGKLLNPLQPQRCWGASRCTTERRVPARSQRSRSCSAGCPALAMLLRQVQGGAQQMMAAPPHPAGLNPSSALFSTTRGLCRQRRVVPEAH